MRKFGTIFSCGILILVLLAGWPRTAFSEERRLAVFGDTRSTVSPPGVNTDALGAIVTDIVTNRDVDFALHVGDLVLGGVNLETEFQLFKSTVTSAGMDLAGEGGSGVPYYPVRGNHDEIGTDVVTKWQNYFGSYLPQNGPTEAPGGGGSSEVGMTYSFTRNNYLFLAVDEYRNTNHRTHNEWVDNQLAGVTQNVITYGHDPAYQADHSTCLAQDQVVRDGFLTSLYNAGGRLYFAGHDHFNAISRVYEKDPAAGGSQKFYQVIIGAGGAPFYDFDGVYNSDYPADYAVTDLYHDSDTTHSIPSHYSYAIVTFDDDLLWLRLYGTESVLPADWQLLYALVIAGSPEVDTGLLTSDLMNETGVTFNQTTVGTYANVISGDGGLTKEGGGKLTLSGVNTYNGGTTVNAGTLQVTGSLVNSAVTVNWGGVLMGTGPINGLTNFGIVRPGNSVGILNLGGAAFVQGPGGTLEIEVASVASFDQIVNASTATLNGTLRTITDGGYAAGNTLVGVLQTAGGITGAFSFLNTQITPTLIWQPRVNGNNLNLVAARNYINDVLKLWLTENQKAVASSLQSVLPNATGDTAVVRAAIDSLPTNADVAAAYSEISPEKLSGIPLMAFSRSAMHFGSLQNRMNALRAMELHPNPHLPGAGDVGFFIQGEGDFGDRDRTVRQPGFTYSAGGTTAGVDVRFLPNVILGVDAGYTHTRAEFGGSGGDIDNETVSYGVYGTTYLKHLYLNFSSGGSSNFYDISRHIKIGPLGREARGDTYGQQWDLFLGTGYDLNIRKLSTGPTATMQYSKFWLRDYTEQEAGSLNLDVSDQKADSYELGFGWRAEARTRILGRTVVANAAASYQHEFLNSSRMIRARLGESGGAFEIETDDPSRNFLRAGGGLVVKLTKWLSLNIGYRGELSRKKYVVHSLEGSLSADF